MNGKKRGAPRQGRHDMKGIIAWFLGIPIVVIVIFYLLGVF